MRTRLPIIAGILAAGALLSGCANPEQKLGRGITNVGEIVRLGEMRRSVEQTAITDAPDYSYASGFVKGFNRTIARTGIGVYEVLTFPLPPYGPVATSYLTPGPVYPDSYVPNLVEGSTFATDANLGFSGGDIAPIVPGSKFHIFDTH